jgi:hypothetical protein
VNFFADFSTQKVPTFASKTVNVSSGGFVKYWSSLVKMGVFSVVLNVPVVLLTFSFNFSLTFWNRHYLTGRTLFNPVLSSSTDYLHPSFLTPAKQTENYVAKIKPSLAIVPVPSRKKVDGKSCPLS